MAICHEAEMGCPRNEGADESDNRVEIGKGCEAMSKLSTEEYTILDHTAYRAAGGFYCGNSDAMRSLVNMGLMCSAGHKAFVDDEYFRLTPTGKQALEEKS